MEVAAALHGVPVGGHLVGVDGGVVHVALAAPVVGVAHAEVVGGVVREAEVVQPLLRSGEGGGG